MANSKKSQSSDRPNVALPDLPDPLVDAKSVLRKWVKEGDKLVLGLSGGIDSVVALDVLDLLREPHGFSLSAVHIDHQISANSPRWADFCARLCSARGIDFRSVSVNIDAAGGGTEAAARKARYGVFAEQDADFIITAHHLDDQAETLLLQLLRGAGLKGASAIPEIRELSRALKGRAPRLLRPFLNVARREFEAYARGKNLIWIDDESNDNTSFDRNYVRHCIFPIVERRFPGYRTTFARASRHFATASALLDELAECDAADAMSAGALRIDALCRLEQARANNLLRFFLARAGLILPSAVKLDEIVRQCRCSSDDSRLLIELGDRQLRRFEGSLRLEPACTVASFVVGWSGEARLELPAGAGVLLMKKSIGAGIDAQRLEQHAVTVRTRCGGERLQPDCKRPRRTLKNLLQENRVPPWQRARMPLLFCGETLVWAPGLGVECAYQTAAGEPGVIPEWQGSAAAREAE
ncbi:MAG: tRNA lysidine(34) synthetase TilS [Burkholderiales bacterium]|nr:tRNA lysidine(34) synthetase TilS [Burkholderiales bacterium]